MLLKQAPAVAESQGLQQMRQPVEPPQPVRPFMRRPAFWFAAFAALVIAVGTFIASDPLSADDPLEFREAPGPETTGVPADVQLIPSGSVTVNEPGTVIDALDVLGSITVKADNVIISNSRINADGRYYGIRLASGVKNLTIVDSEIYGARSAAVSYGRYNAYRLNVHSSRDGLLVGSDVVVHSSWIHDLSSTGEGIKSIKGNNVIVWGNHVAMQSSASGGSAIEIRADRGDVTDWLVQGNLLSGGQYTMIVDDRRHSVDNVQFLDNLVEDEGWVHGPARLAAAPSIWSGNVTTTGEVIEATVADAEATVVTLQPPLVVVATTAPPEEDGGDDTPPAEDGGGEPSPGDPEQETTTTAEATSSSVADEPDSTTTTALVVQSTTQTTQRATTTTARATSTTAENTTTTVAPATTAAPPTTAAPAPRSAGPCSADIPNSPSDDPNPAYNGSSGRLPASPNAIPSGYPNSRTTGYCGGGLKASDLKSTGGMKITTNGAVVDGKDIQGGVTVAANNVTIRNSQITSSGRYTLKLEKGFSNLLVENTRIRAVGGEVSTAVYLRGFATMRGVHISGGSDSIKGEQGMLVEDSLVTGVFRRSSADHNDVVQVRTGSNYKFRRNSMIGPWRKTTSVFLFQAKAGAGGGPISDVMLEDNYMSGGGYTIYTMSPDYPLTNATVRNNRIEKDSWRFGWKSNPAGSSYYGNVQIPS